MDRYQLNGLEMGDSLPKPSTLNVNGGFAISLRGAIMQPPLIKINLAERLAPAGGEQWSGLPRFLVPDPRRGLEKHKNDEAATRIM